MRRGLPHLCRGMCKHDGSVMLILNFLWLIGSIRLPLRSTSRSRAVVARRAHNPKVGSSNLPFATCQSLARGFCFAKNVMHESRFCKYFWSPQRREKYFAQSANGRKTSYRIIEGPNNEAS